VQPLSNVIRRTPVNARGNMSHGNVQVREEYAYHTTAWVKNKAQETIPEKNNTEIKCCL
jgi:hypothetical protein